MKSFFAAMLVLAVGSVAMAQPGGADAGKAEAWYWPSNGELVLSANGVVNVYVQSASGAITAPADPGGLPGLLTSNKNRVGITGLAPFSVTDKSFGSIGGGLGVGDLTLNYNSALGQPITTIPFSTVAGSQAYYVPEPASLGMIGLGLVGLLAARRRS